MASFARTYLGAFVHPRRTMTELAGDSRRLRLGAAAFSIAVVGYTLVYVFLVFGHGRPTVFTPWLAIPAEDYYRWDRFLLAPSMVMSWLLAAAVAQLLSRALGGKGAFEDTLSVLGFGIGVASRCSRWASPRRSAFAEVRRCSSDRSRSSSISWCS